MTILFSGVGVGLGMGRARWVIELKTTQNSAYSWDRLGCGRFQSQAVKKNAASTFGSSLPFSLVKIEENHFGAQKKTGGLAPNQAFFLRPGGI